MFIVAENKASKYHVIQHPILAYKNVDITTCCNCETVVRCDNENLQQLPLSLLKNVYKKHLQICDLVPKPLFDIGIHIRSGDAFRVGTNPHYYQPPLFFYNEIMEKYMDKSIVVVYECAKNPVVNKLLAQYKHKKNIYFYSSDICDDISTLASCKKLAVSNGTFWLAPYFESNSIDALIIPDYLLQNIWYSIDVNHEVIHMPNYQLDKKWSASLEQCERMLEYNPNQPDIG